LNRSTFYSPLDPMRTRRKEGERRKKGGKKKKGGNHGHIIHLPKQVNFTCRPFPCLGGK